MQQRTAPGGLPGSLRLPILGGIRVVLLDRRYGILAAEPAMQIDILAARGTERGKLRRFRALNCLAADRAGAGRHLNSPGRC